MEVRLSTSVSQRPPQKHRKTSYAYLQGPLLSILARVDPYFPNIVWDKLLDHTELTLILLIHATLNPHISAWEFFNGSFDFAATPLVPIGCKVTVHKKKSTRKSWDQRVRECYNTRPALDHYWCFRVVDKQKKELWVSDTVEFLHAYLTQPTTTPEYRISHAIHFLFYALKDVPSTLCYSQRSIIDTIRNIF